MRRKGLLITIEGGEGSGKSTQIRALHAYLRRNGRRVFLTREPGGTRVSDAIRSLLLDSRNKGMSGVCETLLYMASRAQLVKEVIEPKLREGAIVLCDRWLDATVAYQGYGEGVDTRWIRSLGRRVTGGLEPALTIFLDLPVRIGLKRAKSYKRADRMEQKDLAFHRRVRRGYLEIIRAEPLRFRRVAIREKDSVWNIHQKVREIVNHVL